MANQQRAVRSVKDRQYLAQIGSNIRKIRNQRGYSQEEFAEIAGFSRSYYTEIETGKRNISVLNLIKIAETLKAEWSEILDIPYPSTHHQYIGNLFIHCGLAFIVKNIRFLSALARIQILLHIRIR